MSNVFDFGILVILIQIFIYLLMWNIWLIVYIIWNIGYCFNKEYNVIMFCFKRRILQLKQEEIVGQDLTL